MSYNYSMNDNLEFVLTNSKPSPEDKKVIVDGMLAYHANQGHPRKKRDFLTILIKDKKNSVLGGIIVTFLWNGMEIETLWTDESIRGKGYGTKLVEMVEEEALKKGCSIAYTNTFTWQAPEFYEKLGYTLYGKLDNFPKGNSLSYFYKELI